MRFETEVEIEAPLARVWSTLVDVERWPEWTSSITRIDRLGSEPLGTGSRVRIKQPRMPALLWQVTELRPESEFTWQATSSGVGTVATHVLNETQPGRVTVRLGVRQSGALAPLVGLLMGRTTRRYLRLEADGLKQRSEAG